MPTFQIKTPDGHTYEVEAPEGATDAQVLDRIKSQYQAAPPDPYANKSTADLKKAYQQAKAAGADDRTLARISDAYVGAEQKDAGFLGRGVLALDTAARQVARGVPIVGGALDEINAATNALMGGDYGESLDYQRARDRFAEDAAPGATAALQIGGGVASGLGAVRALGLGVGSAVPLAQRVIGGVAAGAPIGAADFFLRGEGGADNRAVDAAIGAGTGAILGGVAPVVGAGLSAGARRIFDMLTSDQMLNQLGIGRGAANILLRQLTTDGALTGAGAQRIRAAGRDAMVADAGESTTNLLDTALQRSGPGSAAARRAIEERATNANAQLNAASDRTFGQVQSTAARENAIRTGTQAARGNAYEAAYNAPIDYQSPAGQRIAALWARVRGNRREAANALLEEGGHQPIAEGALPDVRQIDYVTRALNNVAESGEGQGALGGINATGRSAQDLARQLRDSLRQAVPEYGTALDTAADPIRRVQAVRFGRTLLDDSVSADDAAREVAGMTGAERREAITSVRAALDDVASRVKGMASDPNTDARELRAQLGKLTSRLAREKVALLLGSPPRAAAYFRNVDRSMRALELRASVARNSRTYGRQAIDEAAKAEVEPGIIRTLLQARPAVAAKKLIQRVTGMDPQRQLEELDRLYGQIANALTTRRGRDAQQFLSQLRQAMNAQMANRAPSVGIGRIGQSGFAGAAPAAANQLVPR